ncbi:MAG TPA: hypothetical protein VHE30_20175 [Polyangiaceae bacterium]|nr:hypothetical protein [Polyangiaceae bacterium]
MWRSARAGAVAAVLFLAGSARATCFDGVRNGPESDVDCGGDCVPCEEGDRCVAPRDCVSGRCSEGECEERPYVKGADLPPGYHLEPMATGGPATARTIGWVSLGVGYGAAYVTALSLPGEVGALYVPVFGPWIEVGDRTQGLRGLIAVDGLLQTVGAGLVIGGLIAGGKQIVRDDPVLAHLVVTPARIGRDGYGLFMQSAF